MDISTLSIELDKASRRKVVNSRFKLLQNIGHGQFGKVLLAQDLTLGPDKYVAIKTINRMDTTRLITKTYLSHTTKIKREIQIMKECDHPNVVKLFQVIDDMKFDKILLVLEYCALGEIDWKRYNHYHEKYFKDPSRRLLLNRVLRDVTNGLEYLHSYKHIIHRDLKPSNLLISSDRTIKIADFGVSLILENNKNDDKELGKTMGTPAFFAPELCQFVNHRLSSFNENDLLRAKIDARIDLWSLGVTLYCMFFHQLPFEGFNEFVLFKNIVNGRLTFPTTKRSSLAKSDDLEEAALLEDLITRLLEKDPQKRASIAEIKAHAFTTFDLTKPEAAKFSSMNRQLIAAQSPQAAADFLAESRLTQRLRKVFISRTGASSGTTSPSIAQGITANITPNITQAASTAQRGPVNISELENVDDLLDSYLDDSDSLGSFDDTEAQVIETTDLFEPPATGLKYPDAHLRNSSPGALTSEPGREVPPPLKLSTSNFDLSRKNAPVTQKFGERTPNSAHPVVTIGPDSPSSMKSVFSPSRRFFSRFKRKTTEPTISALSGAMGVSGTSSYTNLAPPPTLGSWEKPVSNRSSFSSVDSGFSSRKNSVSSGASGMISKMSSSSSSLNLHAYLMESPAAGGKGDSYGEREDGGRDEAGEHQQEESDEYEDCTEAGDETKSVQSSDEANRTMSMDQFLDQLDQ